MPRFKPNMCISDCWSSFGNITFYHRNGICYFKSKPYCEFAGTTEQLENLNLHRRAIRVWQSLSHNSQMIWRYLAKDVIAHRPPFDNTSHISGYNLFVSTYHGFAQLGNEHIPEPRQFEPFPIFSLDFVECSTPDDINLLLSFRLTMCCTQDYSRYRVLGKIQLTTPGSGRNPGLMRNNLSTSIPESESVEFVPSVPLGGTRDNSHALCPCVLTENGFMTNEEECRWLMTEEAIESIAMTHVEGIVSYLAD